MKMSKTDHSTSRLAVPALFGIILSILAGACATTEKTVAEKPKPTHFTLKMQKEEVGDKLVPTGYPIHVDWYEGEQLMVSEPAFRGWDFNGDGRIEMLEQVDTATNNVKLFYDFDFDGRIDVVHEVSQGEAQKKLKAPEKRSGVLHRNLLQ
jgi:hypothetical protein